MKIIPLSEGAFTVDATKKFVPFIINSDNLQQRPAGSLLVEIQPFAVVTKKDVVLLDTGLGFSNSDGTLQIHQNLINNDIDPLAVTKVLMSHLHKDHSGGIALENKNSLSFPNATYYVNEKEYAFAMQKGEPSYIKQNFELLSQSRKIKFINDDGIIDGYIHYKLTGAHCPYHQVFWIEEDRKKVFFGGDVAPQLIQMKTKFIAKYDYDGKKCSELRQQWWQQGQQENWVFLFYHDIKTPVFGV